MRAVFADTHYWIALTDLTDQWHDRAVRASRSLGEVHLVTTDSVLSEFLTFFAAAGPVTREAVAHRARDLIASRSVEVVPETRELFLEGLALYEKRPDKSYSLPDCISMHVMRVRRIHEVLTHDEHFTQEGFTILLGG